MASTLNVTGLSGIDTQEWIDQLISAKRKTGDSLFQNQQLLLWKQEAYQEQYTSLSKLRDLAFDLKLESNYSSKKVSSSNSQIATATATTSAGNASYVLDVTQLASVAVNSSTEPVSIRSSVTGKEIDLDSNLPTDPDITIDATNNSFQIKLDDGSYQTITLAAATYTGETGLKDLAADIQEQLDGTFTAATDPSIYVRVTSDNQLLFYAGQKSDGSAHTIVLNSNGADTTLSSLGFSNYDSTKAITGSILTNAVTVNDSNNKFKISIGGVTQEVTLDAGAYGDYGGTSTNTLQDLAAVIEQKLKDLDAQADGDFDRVDVSVNDYNQIVFNYEDTSGGTPKSITLQSGSSNDILNELGIATGSVSDYPRDAVTTKGTLISQKDKFVNTKFFDDLDAAGKNSFGFTINGQSFSFSLNSTATSSGASLASIIAEINGNSAAGVSVYYDEYSDKLVMTSTKTGNNNESGNEIQITDSSGFFTNLLNTDFTKEQGGENAQVKINGVATERAGNSFTMNGVTFNLTDEGKTTLTVSTDVSGVASKVEEFIDKYNEIVGTINGELTEARATSGDDQYYLPLTDEQREVLSDDQIEAWEKKAKQGILRRDSLLSGLVNDLRDACSKTVSTPRTISGIPLTSSINLVGTNRISVTLGKQRPKEIVLDETSDTVEEARMDLQQKLNEAFGQGQIRVEIKNNALSLTTQNTALTLNSGSSNDGLNALGFSNGATVSASYDRLSQIGITTGDYTENGKLDFDKEAFQAALEEDPEAVIRLLTNFEDQDIKATDKDITKTLKRQKEENSKGIIYKLHEVLTASITNLKEKAGVSGTVGGSNAIGEELNDLNERVATFEERLEAYRDRITSQFAAMERAIANMNSQASYLSGMLGS